MRKRIAGAVSGAWTRTTAAAANASQGAHRRIDEQWQKPEQKTSLIGLATATTVAFAVFAGFFAWYALAALQTFFESLGWQSLGLLAAAIATGAPALYLWAVITNRPKFVPGLKPRDEEQPSA